MLNWLDGHGGLALWLGGVAAMGLLACAASALVSAAERRRREAIARLWVARHPISALCESARELRDKAEQGGPLRPADLAWLAQGMVAQRIRDVRALQVEALPSPRAVEAAYEAREAAARLMVWLERLNVDPVETRLGIQTIWKALHDATGNLQRDLAALEGSIGRRLRL